LIQRSPNPYDKRSSLISLMALALQKVPAAKEIMQRGNDEALQGFSDRETATLVRLLSRVIRSLDPEVAGKVRPVIRRFDAYDKYRIDSSMTRA